MSTQPPIPPDPQGRGGPAPDRRPEVRDVGVPHGLEHPDATKAVEDDGKARQKKKSH